MIDTIFYFVEHESDYLAQRENISPKTIVFVQDTHEIYLNGWAYGKTSTAGLATIEDYNGLVDTINRQRDTIALINNQLTTLRENLANEIAESVGAAFTDEESIRNNAVLNGQIDQKIGEWASRAYLVTTDSTTWSDLTQNVNSISGKITSIEHNFDGSGNLKQSVIDAGINASSAYTNLTSRWAVVDANQQVIQWMASGFSSEAQNGGSFAQMYAATANAASQAKTWVDENSANVTAFAQWKNTVGDSGLTYLAGLSSSAGAESAIASLIAAGQTSGANDTVYAAIEAIVQGDISQINLVADQINLEGIVTANGGFKIDSSGNVEVVKGKIGAWQIGMGANQEVLVSTVGDGINEPQKTAFLRPATADGDGRIHFSLVTPVQGQLADSQTAALGYNGLVLQVNGENTNKINVDGSGLLGKGVVSWTTSNITIDAQKLNFENSSTLYQLDVAAAVTAGILVPVSNA